MVPVIILRLLVFARHRYLQKKDQELNGSHMFEYYDYSIQIDVQQQGAVAFAYGDSSRDRLSSKVERESYKDVKLNATEVESVKPVTVEMI